MATQCVKEGPVQNGDLDLVAAGEFASWFIAFLLPQEQFTKCFCLCSHKKNMNLESIMSAEWKTSHVLYLLVRYEALN